LIMGLGFRERDLPSGEALILHKSMPCERASCVTPIQEKWLDARPFSVVAASRSPLV
jgi:hypothetical protein